MMALYRQPKLPPISVRKDSISDCSNKKCKEVIADLRAKVYDLNLMFKELSLTREKVIKYDLLCVCRNGSKVNSVGRKTLWEN